MDLLDTSDNCIWAALELQQFWLYSLRMEDNHTSLDISGNGRLLDFRTNRSALIFDKHQSNHILVTILLDMKVKTSFNHRKLVLFKYKLNFFDQMMSVKALLWKLCKQLSQKLSFFLNFFSIRLEATTRNTDNYDLKLSSFYSNYLLFTLHHSTHLVIVSNIFSTWDSCTIKKLFKFKCLFC